MMANATHKGTDDLQNYLHAAALRWMLVVDITYSVSFTAFWYCDVTMYGSYSDRIHEHSRFPSRIYINLFDGFELEY